MNNKKNIHAHPYLFFLILFSILHFNFSSPFKNEFHLSVDNEFLRQKPVKSPFNFPFEELVFRSL